jgi:small subunit ribosomal protein S9
MQHYGTGRRKSSKARVFLKPGNGTITVDRVSLAARFPTASIRKQIIEPLELTESLDRVDIFATTKGGGFSGQAGALRLGISRALLGYNPELRSHLKKAGFLTRDARIKERKKYGLAGARKKFQFSKR